MNTNMVSLVPHIRATGALMLLLIHSFMLPHGHFRVILIHSFMHRLRFSFHQTVVDVVSFKLRHFLLHGCKRQCKFFVRWFTCKSSITTMLLQTDSDYITATYLALYGSDGATIRNNPSYDAKRSSRRLDIC